MSNQSKIQMPNGIVRNEGDVDLNATEFVMLLLLKKYWFLSGKKETFELDHKKFMCNLGVGDNRTFKKLLDGLHKQGFILEKIEKLPRGKPLEIKLNIGLLEVKSGFTQLPTSLLDWVDEIGHMGVRLMYLYESYINRYDSSVKFCFVGFNTIEKMFKCTSRTIYTHNELLVKHKLLKITRHQLKTDYQYNDDDALVYQKFNNHYEVRIDAL